MDLSKALKKILGYIKQQSLNDEEVLKEIESKFKELDLLEALLD